MTRKMWVATLIVGAMVVAGCGSSEADPGPDPIGAQQVAEAMVADARAGFTASACSHLNADGLARYEAAQSASCKKALRDSILSTYTYEVSDLTISPDGEQAAVRVHNDAQLSNIPFLLEAQEGDWRISMIGVQADRATDEVLRLVEEGGFDPEQFRAFYMP